MKEEKCKGTAIHDHSVPMSLDLVARVLFRMSARELIDDIRKNKDGKWDRVYDFEGESPCKS